MQPPKVRTLLLIRLPWFDVAGIVVCSFQFGLLTQKRIEAGEWQASEGERARRLSSGASNFPPSPPLLRKRGPERLTESENFFGDRPPGVADAKKVVESAESAVVLPGGRNDCSLISNA